MALPVQAFMLGWCLCTPCLLGFDVPDMSSTLVVWSLSDALTKYDRNDRSCGQLAWASRPSASRSCLRIRRSSGNSCGQRALLQQPGQNAEKAS